MDHITKTGVQTNFRTHATRTREEKNLINLSLLLTRKRRITNRRPHKTVRPTSLALYTKHALVPSWSHSPYAYTILSLYWLHNDSFVLHNIHASGSKKKLALSFHEYKARAFNCEGSLWFLCLFHVNILLPRVCVRVSHPPARNSLP